MVPLNAFVGGEVNGEERHEKPKRKDPEDKRRKGNRERLLPQSKAGAPTIKGQTGRRKE